MPPVPCSGRVMDTQHHRCHGAAMARPQLADATHCSAATAVVFRNPRLHRLHSRPEPPPHGMRGTARCSASERTAGTGTDQDRSASISATSAPSIGQEDSPPSTSSVGSVGAGAPPSQQPPLLQFEEAQEVARRRGICLYSQNLGPFYRIICREGAVLGATGFSQRPIYHLR